MARPIGGARSAAPIDGPCSKCGAVHDQTKCKGHKRIDDGWRQCRSNKLTDQDVCAFHGGRSPQARAAAQTRGLEREARKTLGRLSWSPISDPLSELQDLAGKAKAWLVLLEEHVADLERLRYSSAEGGEHIRGEIVLFERAIDQLRRLLVDMARLDIDQRLMRITEAHVGQALAIIDAFCRRRGLDPGSPEVARDKAAAIAEVVGAVLPAIEGTVAA